MVNRACKVSFLKEDVELDMATLLVLKVCAALSMVSVAQDQTIVQANLNVVLESANALTGCVAVNTGMCLCRCDTCF